jgi:hypothetical protein
MLHAFFLCISASFGTSIIGPNDMLKSTSGRYESSLTNQYVTTVVRLTPSVYHPSHASGWQIKMGSNNAVCQLDERDTSDEIRHHRARSQLAALQGYSFELSVRGHDVKFSPNSEILIDSVAYTRQTDPTQVESDTSSTDSVVYFPTSTVALYKYVTVSCMHTDSSPSTEDRSCSVGDSVPNDPSRVITRIFTNSQSVEIVSTTSSNENPFTLPASSIGCRIPTIDGILTVSKVTIHEDSVVAKKWLELQLLSPVCASTHQQANEISLLKPLNGYCVTTNYIGRQFEYCHDTFSPRIRFVQPKPRVHAKWPTAVSAASQTNSPLSEWNIRNRFLYAAVQTTGTLCAINQPAFGEHFTISVTGIPSLAIPGIGGSFNPMTYPNREGLIRGVAVYDENHPYGCEENAFPKSLLPQTGAPWIAVIDRGSCMFQDKGLNLQRRGAVAVIVVNGAKNGMIGALAGLPEKPVLDIPVILVDREGSVLKSNYLGREIVVKSATWSSLSEKISFKTEWYCDANWDSPDSTSFASQCSIGDKVLLHREGEMVELHATIVEKFGGGFFKIRTDSGASETVSGWQLFKDSSTPCTAELGTLITDVIRSDTCLFTVRLHSSLLCADKRFRKPKHVSRDIICQVGGQ